MKRPLRVSGAAFCFAALLYGFEQSVRQDRARAERYSAVTTAGKGRLWQNGERPDMEREDSLRDSVGCTEEMRTFGRFFAGLPPEAGFCRFRNGDERTATDEPLRTIVRWIGTEAGLRPASHSAFCGL